MPNHDQTVGCANSSGITKLSVPTTSTPTSSNRIAIQATRYQPREPEKIEREGREDVHERRDGRERVGERGLVVALDDLDERASGGGERHDRVDDHEHAADAGHAGAGGRRRHNLSILSRSRRWPRLRRPGSSR